MAYYVDATGVYLGSFEGEGVVIPDGAIEVPVAPENALQKWVGGVWQALTVEDRRSLLPPLTRRQFRLGMASIGLTKDAIDAQIAQIADPNEREIALIEWQEASQFERLHPLVLQLSADLGVTAEQIDALWEQYKDV